jgi:hypothetical protein
MQVVVDEAERIGANMLKISNKDMLDLVEKKLGISGLSSVKIGKAASALGLIKAKWAQGSIRGWTVPGEKITSFKTTVPTVPTVPSPCGSKGIFGAGAENDLSPSVPAHSSTQEAGDSGDGSKKDMSPDERIEAMGLGTVGTVGTVGTIGIVGTVLPEQNFTKEPTPSASADFPAPEAGDSGDSARNELPHLESPAAEALVSVDVVLEPAVGASELPNKVTL